MASYKKMYEAAMEECRALQGKMDEMTSLDRMTDGLTDQDAKQFVLSFAEKCNNRAELSLLIRVVNRLGA